MTRSIRTGRRWAPATAAVVLLTSLVPASLAPALADPALPASALADPASPASAPAAASTDDGAAVDVCAGVPARAFRDVPAGNLHLGNIDCVAGHDLVLGVGGGNYAPSRSVTRGQMASFLVNLVEVAREEEADRSQLIQPFADAVGTTHGDNVAVAAGLGIARGLTARSFGPQREVTRAQMATFVVESIVAAGGSLPASATAGFHDLDGSVHAGNIRALATARIVSGVGDGAYDPAGTVSRAHMATFLAGAVRYLAEGGHWPELPAEEVDLTLRLTSVVRPGAEIDLVELHWNLPVTAQAAASGYRVYGADGSTLVARGTEVVAAGEAALRVQLDAGLQDGSTYWLELPAEAVVADDGATSAAASVAFVFSSTGSGTGDAPGTGTGSDTGDTGTGSDTGTGDDATSALPHISGVAVAGTEVAAGGSITVQDPAPVLTGTGSAAGSTVASASYRVAGGAWTAADAVDGAFDAGTEAFTATLGPLAVGSHAVEVRVVDALGLTSAPYTVTIEVGELIPTITSVVTDPAADRLVVTFDTAVVCPDTPDSRSAFLFLNDGASADPSLERGFADSVSNATDDAKVCWIGYSVIEESDQGSLSYSQPQFASDRVTAVDGGHLESVMGITVTPAG